MSSDSNSRTFSHVDSKGKARMVDVSPKTDQLRTAKARGFIVLQPGTISLIKDNTMKKGDVLTTAEIAGIQAAKRTSDLIPLCHPLAISKIDVTLEVEENGIRAASTVRCIGRTGVEMEALTGVSTALLTVYDMCKAVDKQMEITDIVLCDKTKEDI